MPAASSLGKQAEFNAGYEQKNMVAAGKPVGIGADSALHYPRSCFGNSASTLCTQAPFCSIRKFPQPRNGPLHGCPLHFSNPTLRRIRRTFFGDMERRLETLA